MKLAIAVFYFSFWINISYSQDLIKKTDSLIQTIESSKKSSAKGYCDTFFVSHTDYLHSVCVECYSFEPKLIKIVKKYDRFKMTTIFMDPPAKTGTISVDTFYFYDNLLIKAVSYDYDPGPLAITYLYFTGNDLQTLEQRGLKATDEYRRAERSIRLAYELLDSYRRNK